ncbi:MAG: hypothetical protein JXC33_07925 [Deltaproteobacteria bacterium]|nr:hypothetical protein [Deltaproteobacteria bacterium]
MFKNFRNYIAGMVGSAGAVLFGASHALATPFFTAPTVDATLVGTMVTSILASLALIWGARKAIKVINRS